MVARKPIDAEQQRLEKHARTMRRAHETGSDDMQQKAVDAHNELHQPEHAKARPLPDHGSSNAGNDGGA